MLINGAKQCSCSVTGFLHELVWGQTYKKSDDPTKWIGMEAIVGKDGEFNKIIDQLTNKIPAKIAASFNTDTENEIKALKASYTAIVASIDGFYTSWATKTTEKLGPKTITNPDPLAASTDKI